MPADHNRLINHAARTVLKPKGLSRLGSSRTWIDDHGWWIIQVEFQPSGFSRGSYLNVGVCWLLYEGSHASFHVGYRVDTPFLDSEDSEFETKILDLVDIAANEVDAYRAKFATMQHAAEYYHALPTPTTWDRYHAGIICGLLGEVDMAREYLEVVSAHSTTYDWEQALALRAEDLLRILTDLQGFRNSVLGIVLRTRAIGCLPALEQPDKRRLWG